LNAPHFKVFAERDLFFSDVFEDVLVAEGGIVFFL